MPVERAVRPRCWPNLAPGRAPFCSTTTTTCSLPSRLSFGSRRPYAGEVRDGKFYARGVADDRGDLLARVLAMRAYQATLAPLPLRLRWLIEGEEEVGSPHLAPVVEHHADELQADWCAWEGAGATRRTCRGWSAA